MCTMYKVRTLDVAEIPGLVDWLVRLPLMQRYRLEAPAARRMLTEALDRQDHIIAADTETMAASGFAWIMPTGAFGRSAYLRLIAVHPNLAGRGIGAALLAEAERLAAAAGRDLFLLVSDFNVEAQAFYARHGFRQIGAIPAYVLPDVTELIFWKPRQQHSEKLSSM